MFVELRVERVGVLAASVIRERTAQGSRRLGCEARCGRAAATRDKEFLKRPERAKRVQDARLVAQDRVVKGYSRVIRGTSAARSLAIRRARVPSQLVSDPERVSSVPKSSRYVIGSGADFATMRLARRRGGTLRVLGAPKLDPQRADVREKLSRRHVVVGGHKAAADPAALEEADGS